MAKANFGFMGLGVMGHMLALNMERNGFHVAGYDLDTVKTKAFLAGAGAISTVRFGLCELVALGPGTVAGLRR